MTETLYIFSNDPVPPVKSFKEGLSSDYISLSSHLNPTVSVAPSYDTPKGSPVKNLEEHKENHPDYKFVHIYKVFDSEIIDGNEVFNYKHSHKEFNLKSERKRA